MSTAAKVRRDAAFGLSQDHWSHEDPTRGLDKLLPARVGYPIELERIPTRTSVQVQDDLESRGARVESLPWAYYRSGVLDGTNRALNNEDWLKGKKPIYGEGPEAMDLVKKIAAMVGDLAREEREFYEKDSRAYLSAAELEDNDKITAQQWKPCGFFNASPITDAVVPPLDDWHRKWVDKIVGQRYERTLKSLHLPTDIYSLILLDDDPPDTMTGAPTYASGDRTHEARVAQLNAITPPDIPAEEWILRLKALSDKLGIPEPILWSPVLATRHGPLRKPVLLWYRTDGGYVADYQATGAYDRTRFVYPIPYYINFLLSPLYVQMSSVRKHTLGLWHDPESQARYIEALRAQGGKPYTIDFSGMDTGMFKHVVLEFFQSLRRHGFCKWPLDMIISLYPEMGLIYPHFYGDPNAVSSITGDATPWMSGFKLTSEMDTLYGMTVLLSCLSLQIPDIFDRWISGKWVFLELGDDIMFTLDHDINPDQLADDALRLWGAKLKILDDVMFLKWLIPVVPEVPSLTRTFARFMQQTFYNEDRYDGVEGGDRPDAVMRMGLFARMQGLDKHPDFQKWWPKTWEILKLVKYVDHASDAYKEKLAQGIPALDSGDIDEIQNFAVRNPDYFLKLRDRAKYEPSAANLLREVSELGLALDMDPVAAQLRQIYLNALRKSPDESDVEVLAQYASQFFPS